MLLAIGIIFRLVALLVVVMAKYSQGGGYLTQLRRLPPAPATSHCDTAHARVHRHPLSWGTDLVP